MKSNGFNIRQGCVGAGCSTRWGCQLAQELHVGHEQRLCCPHLVGWAQECVPGLAPSATEPVFCTCTYPECTHTQNFHVRLHVTDAEGLCITRGVSVGPNTAMCSGRVNYCSCFIPRDSKDAAASPLPWAYLLTHMPVCRSSFMLGHWPVLCVQLHSMCMHTCFPSLPMLPSAHAIPRGPISVLAPVLLHVPALSFSSVSFPQIWCCQSQNLSPGGGTKPPRLGRLRLGDLPLIYTKVPLPCARKKGCSQRPGPFRLCVLTALSQMHINQHSPRRPAPQLMSHTSPSSSYLSFQPCRV